MRTLDAHWQVIRDECTRGINYGTVDPLQFPDRDWTVLMLVYMRKETRHMATHPQTAALLRGLGVDVRNAFFSTLGANTTLPPHTGVMNSVLRYHLGLDCPGRAWLDVNDVCIPWENGKSFVWNDIYRHSAHNHGQPRTILFIDIGRTDMSPAEKAVDEGALATVHGMDDFGEALLKY